MESLSSCSTSTGGVPSTEEQRRSLRRVCPVLSQVFACGASHRYLGPGIVLDLSDSGISLMVDQPPAADIPLFIKNIYFNVQATIRNRVPTKDGTRLGLEFTSPIDWHGKRDALPMGQLSSPAPKRKSPCSAGKQNGDLSNWYRRCLVLLERARTRLPETVTARTRRQDQDTEYERSRKESTVPTGNSEKSRDCRAESLQMSEEYRNFFRYSLNGFNLCEVILDDDGHVVDFIILEANQPSGYITGANDSVGKRVSEVWPGIEHDSTFAAFSRVALSGEPRRFEQFVNVLGKHLEFSAFSPKKGQVAIFFTDVTDRKLAEDRSETYARELERTNDELVTALSQVREALELKREFLNNVSHEMRTPMNAVLGITGLLLDSPLNREQREYAETVNTAAGALMRVIEDLLHLSGIQAGNLGVDRGPVDVSALVRHVMSSFEDSARCKRLTLVYSDQLHDVDTVFGDAARLERVLRTLLDNAVKFTERGGVILTARVIDKDADRVAVGFEVQDTGIGIRPERRNSIFEPFVQADGSATRKYEGAGLGLAIAKQFIELMGGEIGVVSEPDAQGATFWFVVPLTTRI
jgi:signal transduction histidine kinase